MKHILYRYIPVLLALVSAMPIMAQETQEEKKVTVAYRQVDKEDLIGNISAIDYEELSKNNYNLSTFDVTASFVPGWNGNSLWGFESYIVMVDGFQRDHYSALPSEIASISFLKGAAAVALYGTQAIDGVILITTKRGVANMPLQITANVNTGFHFAKEIPEYLGAAEYMNYYNQASENDGLGTVFSDDQIYNYASGNDPYRYPNVDLFSSDYIKNYYNRTDASVEIRGGTKNTKYYSNIGYINEGNYLNFGEAANSGTNRVNVRGNVDMRISNIVTSFVNANVTLHEDRSANGDFWGAARDMRPNRIAPLLPISAIDPSAQGVFDAIGTTNNIIDGKYFLGGSQVDPTNIVANYYASGSTVKLSRTFQFNTGLDIDLSGITKGLNFGGVVGIDYISGYSTSYNNTYAIFEPVWSNMNGTSSIVGVKQFGKDQKSGSQNLGGQWMTRRLTGNVHFDYNRSFGNHNIYSILLGSVTQSTVTGVYHDQSCATLGFQLAYNYAHKYYVDFSSGLSYSAKLAKGNRLGLSPALTLGWNIANEGFLENSSAVDNLVLSASVSSIKSDLDITDFYAHEAIYNNKTYAGFGWGDGKGVNATFPIKGGNPDLTYIARNEVSLNLKGEFFNKSLSFDLSAFRSVETGGLTKLVNNYPMYFTSYWPEASFVPTINYNKDRRQGIDLALNYKFKANDFRFNVGVVAAYVTEFIELRDENLEDEYQKTQGTSLNAIWGLESDGLFASDAEIIESGLSYKFGEDVKPGDIKYVDQNNDNEINDRDRVVIGNWASPFFGGLNLNIGYKNLSLFLAATASTGGQGMRNTSYDRVHGEMKYSAVVRDAWTAETAETATYPRLTTGTGTNNFRDSQFWMYDSSRIDLSKVQLTYDFSDKLFENSVMKSFSVYLGGYNLLTIAPEAKRLNTNFWGAPYSRFVNLGIKATF